MVMSAPEIARSPRPRTLGERSRQTVLYALWRLACAAVARAPLRLAYAGASGVAALAWLLLPVQRRNAIANYEVMLGGRHPRAARALARRSFVNYARYAVDFIRGGRASNEEILRRVAFDEWDKIEAIAAAGRGCILVLLHFGNWDIGGQVLALRGYGMNAVAETQPGRINDDFTRIRERRGMRLIPMERGAAGIVRALKRGEFLAILIDRPLREGGVEVEFFGKPVRIPDGPARLALRTGAAVVPAALPRLRADDDRVVALLDFAIAHPCTGDSECDVRELTQRVMRSHERVLRRYPDQWYMFRRFWDEASS